ncbi:hypothetical protein L6164_016763 [Bauhinia variegata]|uniref:Uncharacterized protein n=1 Tax=Bauhinia variegata TaxID=167791 RepID=A0ACB9N5R6_BAUVA|nr:hypothetical protein L6164_016763 [Bauhinia variegata]
MEGNWKEASRVLQENPELLKAAITKGWKTILHVAAGTDHVHFVEELQIAEILISKNKSLPTMRGKELVFPVQLAALQGQGRMTRYRYGKTYPMFEDADWNKLFPTCIKNGIYDLALTMSKHKPSLAFTQDEQEQTGLHILARKQFAKSCKSL